MINRIYIDNFKCFVNFDWRPKPMQLLLGDNGSGKTSVFDVLETLREFVCSGTPSARAFPSGTLTAWDTRPEQTYEIGVMGNGGQYEYQLLIEHDRQGQRNRIKTEQLKFDETPLYEFDGKDAHLFRDDGSPGPVFPFDWSRSAMATIPQRPVNQRLSWFRQRLAKVHVFSPDPPRMVSRSETELEQPDRPLHQIVSWLRHLSQESVDTVSRLRDCLRDEVIEGLENMKLARISETTRELEFEFNYSAENGKHPFSLTLEQLSEGQRNLVALFAILHAAFQQDSTVCIDEPDNYVALRELQPWLTAIRDRVDDVQGQCLLISHHPESINYLAAHHGSLFHRAESGPVRVKEFEWSQDEAIAPAELVARGWE